MAAAHHHTRGTHRHLVQSTLPPRLRTPEPHAPSPHSGWYPFCVPSSTHHAGLGTALGGSGPHRSQSPATWVPQEGWGPAVPRQPLFPGSQAKGKSLVSRPSLASAGDRWVPGGRDGSDTVLSNPPRPPCGAPASRGCLRKAESAQVPQVPAARWLPPAPQGLPRPRRPPKQEEPEGAGDAGRRRELARGSPTAARLPRPPHTAAAHPSRSLWA